MDTITMVDPRPAAGEVAERFLTGYWCARTRGNYRFILACRSPAGWTGASITDTRCWQPMRRCWKRGWRR
jgi:hypothetical protein